MALGIFPLSEKYNLLCRKRLSNYIFINLNVIVHAFPKSREHFVGIEQIIGNVEKIDKIKA